jgi:hypothetical protein
MCLPQSLKRFKRGLWDSARLVRFLALRQMLLNDLGTELVFFVLCHLLSDEL